MSEEWIAGPTSRLPLRETPELDFANASKTTLSFIIVLLSLRRACIGK